MRTATWNTSSPFIQKALHSGLVFINVKDWDLNDKIEINGRKKPIYDFVKIQIKYPGDWFKSSIETIRTHTYIVVNKNKISRKQLNLLLSVANRLGNGLWK